MMLPPSVRIVFVFLSLGLATLEASAQKRPENFRLEVSIAEKIQNNEPLTGRLLVCIARPEEPKKDAHGNALPADEPCQQIDESYHSQQIFGMDVSALKPGAVITLDDAHAYGYPTARFSDLPPGDYTVQAIFNRYEEFHPGGGKAVWLPPEKGEGQQWNQKPGNPMMAPVKMHLDPARGGAIKLRLDAAIPPLPAPEPDTKYLKRITIKSDLLSKFWGRDTSIQAMVLLPAGFDEHPDAHYPVVVWQDHFMPKLRVPAPWRETPPDPSVTDPTARFIQRWSYRLYNDWTGGILPHVILVVLDHANPYYDDSYAVNSANIGPYGDAITREIIPEVERRYRGIGAGWARGTMGGSTGGWEALAEQIFYPDFYNGAWGLCPDPVDFHAYQVTNLYDDTNAYERTGPFETVPTPSDRHNDGDVTAEMAQVNHYELTLATHGRSAEQYDAWQAVFSPAGDDGYPRPVYDKLTGVIDKQTVQYWHDHYDLDAILMRDWLALGPKLEGKLHIAVGLNDTYYLDTAVHLLQQNLEKTQHPHSDAQFDYGQWAPHCYTGAQPEWDESHSLDLQERVLPLMVKHMLATAPEGADVKSWRY